MSRYFTINVGENGISIKEWDKDGLLSELVEEDSGYDGDDAVGAMPSGTDPMEWGDKLIIIKGEIITPTEKQVVTELEMP